MNRHFTPDEMLRADGVTFHGAADLGRFRAKALADCRVDHAADYIIKGVVARGDLALIYGQPGSGKTLLGPLLAHAAATGRRVFGRRTRAGRVLYIAAEAPGDVEVRFVALRMRHGEAPGLHLLAASVDLQDSASDDLEELRTFIARFKPDLIVVDTLAAAFPGLEENESRDMGRATQKLRLLGAPPAGSGWRGAAVVAVHHAPKGGDTPRGHGKLNGDADVTMRVDGQDDAVRTVTFGKNRNGPSGRAFDFAVELVELGTDDDGDAIRRPVAVECEEGATEAAGLRRGRDQVRGEAAEEAETLLRHVEDLIASGRGRTASPEPGMPPVPTIARDLLHPALVQKGWLRLSAGLSAGLSAAESVPEREWTRLWKRLNRLKLKGSVGFNRQDVWLARAPTVP